MNRKTLISAEELAVGYGGPLIRDIQFDLCEGEILTLIGPNGSGKSTIIKTLAGYLQKHGGAVYIENANAESIPRTELAKQLSVLLTRPIQAELMTCRQVVETGRYPYTGRFGLLTQADHEAVENAINMVRIQDFVDADFAAVSDGQRQRVMLARAVCQEPHILILDEPTSYLDICHKICFLEMLKILAQEKRLAVIVSIHELELAEHIADYALCIKNGAVFRAGKPQDIFRDEVICELFDLSPALYAKYFRTNR